MRQLNAIERCPHGSHLSGAYLDKLLPTIPALTLFNLQVEAFLVRAADHEVQEDESRVATSDPKINAARIAGRVLTGGHSVPIEEILARHVRAVANLGSAIAVADRVYVYDNSVDGIEARLCVRTQDRLLRKVYSALPDWIADSVVVLPRHPEFVDLRSS